MLHELRGALVNFTVDNANTKTFHLSILLVISKVDPFDDEDDCNDNLLTLSQPLILVINAS